MKMRLLLVDDHMMIRDGLKALIEKEPDMEVIGEAGNGKEAVKLAAQTGAHVVIMDIVMPELNGIEAARKILRTNSHIRVIGLSAHSNGGYVREMLKAGASAYILKSRAFQELTQAVREVMAGRKYLSPDITCGVIDEYTRIASRTHQNPVFVVLTEREREILQLLTEGKSTKETAYGLSISMKTVETHRRNIMEKLHLHSVADLTKYAIREGITSVDA